MDTIKRMLNRDINMLWERLENKQNEWCNLNLNLNTKSYEDLYNQHYYLLKYYPAYFTEYYHIWKIFFETYNKKHINILSIGCGAGIDFIAFTHILRIKNLKYQYFGIDSIEWKDRNRVFDFTQQEVQNLTKKDFENVDLIVFPKILTELENEELENLADKIINSYITDDVFNRNKVEGIDKFQIICEKLKYKGYKLVSTKCEEFEAISNREQGLRSEYSFFVYPDEIMSNFKKIKGESPILNNKYIAYNILKFVKNDN